MIASITPTKERIVDTRASIIVRKPVRGTSLYRIHITKEAIKVTITTGILVTASQKFYLT